MELTETMKKNSKTRERNELGTICDSERVSQISTTEGKNGENLAK
jgi:hypothetical protein